MIKNRRGEAVTITLVALAVGAILVGFFARPVANKMLPGFLGTDQKIERTKSVESKPVWIKNPDGSQTLVQTTKTTTYHGTLPVPLTFFQKLTQFGIMSIIILLVCAFTPVGAIVLFLFGRLKKALASAKTNIERVTTEKNSLSTDAKLIVKSVDEGLAALDNAIASAQGQIANAQSIADAQAKQLQLAVSQAVLVAMTNAKKDFLTAMSRKQNNTTKLLVAGLKND